MTTPTHFASTEAFEKGGVEIVGADSPKRYLFSNIFEVAGQSRPWERVVVAKNLEFTVECARAEGDSPWYICSHDETVLAMQGEMRVHFIVPDDTGLAPPEDKQGAVALDGEPAGKIMGHVEMGRGHMALLPAGAAYQLRPQTLGVVLMQSIEGEESIERWADICQH
jgi:hypothetical protein